jgi:type IV pilus assembly protein PilY1
MHHRLVENKKDKFLKRQKTLSSAVIAALIAFSAWQQAQAEANIFADIPLHLQKSSTITTAYGVKPNITLFIDDSASMVEKIKEGYSYRCRNRKSIRKNARGRTIAWSPWSDYNYGIEEVPANTNDIQYRCRQDRKIDGVKAVLLNILANYHNDMYFALHPLHKGGIDERYNTFYDTSDSTQYNTLAELIKKMPTHGSTPTTQRFPVVARNLVMNKLKYRCQKSYIILLSDGEAKSQFARENDNGDDDGYFDGVGSWRLAWQPENNAFNVRDYFDDTGKWLDKRKRRDFLHSDKDVMPYRLKFYSETLKEKNFGPYIYNGNFYNDIGNAIFHPSKRTTDEAGQPWNAPDALNGQRPFTQTAETFTIGVGLGQKTSNLGKKAIPYLENGAMPTGNFFNTNTKAEIQEAFQKIFESIKGSSETTTTTTTSTAPTVAVSRSESDNISITAIIESGAWSSKICIRKIDKNKKDNECTAQPSFNNRQLLLNDGTRTYLYSGSLTGLNNDTFKISNNGKNQSEWLNGLLAWLSRSKPDNAIKTDDFVLDYRRRTTSPVEGFGETRDMGDMIDNPIITAGNIDKSNGLQKYMVTSANDGMVYVFRSTNDEKHPYDLKFNFMPMGIERQSNDGSDLVAHYYKDLTHNDYGRNSLHPHRFLLNGGMVVQQTEQSKDRNGNDRPQQTFMVSTMGQAGRGAFAINIGGNELVSGRAIAVDNMGSSGWYNDVSLFQTPTGPNNYFGFTVGTPAIARLRVNEDLNASPTSVANHIREAAFISNGYNYSSSLASDNAGQPSTESALYIYDILGVDVGTDGYTRTGFAKGDLIAKLTPPEIVRQPSPTQDPNSDDFEDDSNEHTGGLSSPTVIDINGDGVADIAYAGDYAGNLYRFDLRSPDPAKWTVHKLFSAGAPITSAPGVILVNNPQKSAIITFGTGSDIYQSDLSNKDQQTVYGIYDNLNEKTPTEISKQSLLKQELTPSGDYRYLSDNPFNPRVNRGWYFDLESGTGERVVSKPITILHSGIIISRKYKTTKDNKLPDPCQSTERKEESEVYSSVIQYNIKTGGKLGEKNPYLDNDAPAGAAVSIQGIYGLKVTGNDRIDIGGDLTQSVLKVLRSADDGGSNDGTDEQFTVTEECTRAPIEGADTKGNVVSIIAPRCPIKFKRLSWREVKTDYTG